MKVLAGHHKGVPVLRIKCDRIDGAAAPEFRKVLEELARQGLSSFVIDLSEVTFIDSSGLGALVSSFKVKGRTGGVAVVGACPAVATLFRITRMDKVFRLCDTVTEAAAAVSATAAPSTTKKAAT